MRAQMMTNIPNMITATIISIENGREDFTVLITVGTATQNKDTVNKFIHSLMRKFIYDIENISKKGDVFGFYGYFCFHTTDWWNNGGEKEVQLLLNGSVNDERVI